MDFHDEWRATWDWARALWGDDPYHLFNAFFRAMASHTAEREGWEELGSSDVWHASYDLVKRLKASGECKDRGDLMDKVRAYTMDGAW